MVNLFEVGKAAFQMIIGNSGVTTTEVLKAGVPAEWMTDGTLESTTVFELSPEVRGDQAKSNLALAIAYEEWHALLDQSREGRDEMHDRIRVVRFGNEGGFADLTDTESRQLHELLDSKDYGGVRNLASQIQARVRNDRVRQIRGK